ncbi:hypothetical protein [Planktotalea sp.]|uniref:CBU_0592 family membrane protein n=1 Tax=Planktotalea sp. TaxID=2029877 RepID=UPI003296E97F
MDQIFDYSQSLGALQVIGVLGFLLYISAFAAVQWGVLNGNSLAYSLANVMSSVFVSISLIEEFNLSAALIQGSVIAIGVTGLALRLRRSRARSRSIFHNTLDGDLV